MNKKIFTIIIYVIAAYFIISLEQEKRQLITDGRIIESKLLSKKEIIDKEHEKLNKNSNIFYWNILILTSYCYFFVM